MDADTIKHWASRALAFAMWVAMFALGMLLAGCGTVPVMDPTPPPPVQLTCAPQAKERCQTTSPRWEPGDANSPEAWKLILPQVVLPLERELSDCDRRVEAAQACLDAAQDKGILIWR